MSLMTALLQPGSAIASTLRPSTSKSVVAALNIEVEWRRGPTGDPEPLLFRMADADLKVAEILDRWPGSVRGYVKFRGDDGGLYILRYENGGERWSLIFYDSGETLPDSTAGAQSRRI